MRRTVRKPLTLAVRARPGLVAALVAGTLLLAVTAVQAGLTPEQKCQVGKNRLAGTYAACRENAEAKRAATGDRAKYNTALDKCAAKFTAAWQKLEGKAVGAGTKCLDGSPTASTFEPLIDSHTTRVAQALSGGALSTDCLGELATCEGDLTTCNDAVATCRTTCNGDLATCSTSLGACSADKATCQTNLATCSTGKATCQASLATATGSLTTCNGSLAACQSNLTVAQRCGNGVVDAGETCDQGNLAGNTCASLGGFQAGTLKCGGDCSFDTSGCFAQRFVDSGDGTVSDRRTGLQWEKKIDPAPCTTAPHRCSTATFTWGQTTKPYAPDGTAYTDFLAHLNGGLGVNTCFASHCDWRLPTKEELEGIVDLTASGCSAGSVCINPIFGPTVDAGYWSATTYGTNPINALVVNFFNGFVFDSSKGNSFYVRAVRAG